MPINGFDHYEVSNWGRVRSLKHRTPKRLKQRFNCKGYKTVGLSRPGKQLKHKLVHRLVAIAFIPNPENKPDVNHLYGMTWDNRSSQLAWATKSENQRHAIATGLRNPPVGDKSKMTRIPDKDVLAIVNSPLPAKRIAEIYKISKGYVDQIRNGRARFHTTKIEKSSHSRDKHGGKIPKEDVLHIFNSKVKAKVICLQYDVPQDAIYAIRSGKRYSNITGKVHKRRAFFKNVLDADTHNINNTPKEI